MVLNPFLKSITVENMLVRQNGESSNPFSASCAQELPEGNLGLMMILRPSFEMR